MSCCNTVVCGYKIVAGEKLLCNEQIVEICSLLVQQTEIPLQGGGVTCVGWYIPVSAHNVMMQRFSDLLCRVYLDVR